MFDPAGFKESNDRLGHLPGSAALKRVSALLRGFVIVPDVAGRYSGDEFIVLLPEIRKHIVEGLAAEITALICARQFRLESD